MEWLNYHHLLYFWTVAREGGVSRAAEKLRLSQPTISAQVRMLEDAIGERLFQRQGRTLVLTDVGRLVYRYGCGSLLTIDKYERHSIKFLFVYLSTGRYCFGKGRAMMAVKSMNRRLLATSARGGSRSPTI